MGSGGIMQLIAYGSQDIYLDASYKQKRRFKAGECVSFEDYLSYIEEIGTAKLFYKLKTKEWVNNNVLTRLLLSMKQ